MMIFLLYLVGFTAGCLGLMHLTFRRFYHADSSVWVGVEYVWCGLSFIALFLAAIQLRDRSDGIVLGADRARLVVLEAEAKQSAARILGATQDLRLMERVQEQLGRPVPGDPGGILRRFSRYPGQAPIEAAANLQRMSSAFCDPLFGNLEDERARLRFAGRYSDDNVSSETGFMQDALSYCLGVQILASTAGRVIAGERDRTSREPVFGIAYYWSFVLALGLALKTTKVTSDLKKLKAKRSAGQPGGAAPSSPTDAVRS